MKRLIAVLLLVCLPIPAIADDRKYGDDLDVRDVAIDGHIYVAFTPADAQKLLDAWKKFPDLQLSLDQHKALVENKDAQIDKLTDANKILLDQNHIMALETVRLNEEVASYNKWYRSPYFWMAVGVIVGGGATIAVVEAVK